MSRHTRCTDCGRPIYDDEAGDICHGCVQRELAETRNREHTS